ncbi:MAG: fumarylacetoacetate hydrolase family protein [Propionibacteriaceae bacterium]|nr:fumarylacetoacetate hydrolase family protein [Propionibacteriaceae bacterium]
MRIARFTTAGSDPAYGIVELAVDGGEHPDTIATLTGDPLAGMKVNYTGERHPLDDVRLLAPVIPRSKIIGVGRNYADHAAELGNEVPEAPLLFFKPNTTVIGPGDAIVCPEATSDLHFEGELAVVIGRIARQVPPERVGEVIFGYTIANDVTARDLQQAEGQWTRAKGWDTFCPIGPWINTHATVEEAGHWAIETRLGDQVRQSANTSQMVRSITDLVCYISEFTTLLPGDLILTGTPAGVGQMRPGDVVSIEIDSLGTLSNPVVSP